MSDPYIKRTQDNLKSLEEYIQKALIKFEDELEMIVKDVIIVRSNHVTDHRYTTIPAVEIKVINP